MLSSKKGSETYIKDTFFGGHYLVGGCSNITDENFEVKDNLALFVCDKSVFLEFVSNNIHAHVVLLSNFFPKGSLGN